jgi:signal transduction histidine kinase
MSWSGGKTDKMNPGLKVRIAIFFTTIVLLVAVVAWTAYALFKLMDELRVKVGEVQGTEIAYDLQQSIPDLNKYVHQYAANLNNTNWVAFVNGSRELDARMAKQKSKLTAEKERALLEKIEIAYHGANENDTNSYIAAAKKLHPWLPPLEKDRLTYLNAFEQKSKRVLEISTDLAKTHQETLNTFQAQTGALLAMLRVTLLGALALLLGMGGWLSFVIYRDMIAPLQVQLVESRQLAERQEKLASLGMLAAGVAHEIRNPLTAIKAWLYMQQKRLKPDTPEFADANLISNEINRLERIVKDVLQFARPSEPKLVVIPAEQPLREVQTLLEPELKKAGIRISLDGAVSDRIRVDADQIKQVLINLVRNAADAIGQNGSVTLRARREEKWLLGRETDVVILEVSDTGKGIPPEVEKRLFDPFFTTKDSGTGLGLPIAARIVEKNQGSLQYQTRLEHGTTFGIILPLAKS